jgi:hypothetical protein
MRYKLALTYGPVRLDKSRFPFSFSGRRGYNWCKPPSRLKTACEP